MSEPPPPLHAELERLTDRELVARARRRPTGETARRCVALVYERNRSIVRGHCAAKCGRDDLDELEGRVYERFVKTCYLGSAPVENPAGLLTVMAKRVIADHHAARKPARPVENVPQDAVAENGYDAVNASDYVSGLLAGLTPRQRTAVSLRYFDDLSSAETAALMGTTAGNVDVIVHRALAEVREAAGR